MTNPTGDALKASAAQVETIAKAMFKTDWPRDDWERFGPKDFATERYRAMAVTAIAALSPVEQAPQPGGVTYTQLECDEMCDIAERDGYEKAVQEIDQLTGGDGEYRYCLGTEDSDRHTPDAPAMIQRIVDRFEILNLLDDATKTGRDQPDDAPTEAPPVESQAAGWQTMATAPRDGSKIDLWVIFETSTRRVPDAYWNAIAGDWQLGAWRAAQYDVTPIITRWMRVPRAALAAEGSAE